MANPKTFKEIQAVIGDFLATSPESGKLWDLMTCLRGPDSPSEKPNMTSSESSAAYRGRRQRKANTVEVIRYHAFGGVVGGAARSRSDRDWVELPPRNEWDHFDRHVERAAGILGLEVRGGESPRGKGKMVTMLGKEESDVERLKSAIRDLKRVFESYLTAGYGEEKAFHLITHNPSKPCPAGLTMAMLYSGTVPPPSAETVDTPQAGVVESIELPPAPFYSADDDDDIPLIDEDDE